MAQKRVTDFFSNCKRADTVHVSKKQRLLMEETSSGAVLSTDNQTSKSTTGRKSTAIKTAQPKVRKSCAKASAKLSVNKIVPDVSGSQSSIVSTRHSSSFIPMPTAACDNHASSPCSTPTKQHNVASKKRVYGSTKEVPESVDRWQEVETPSKGFDFGPYSSPPAENSGDGASPFGSSASACKKLILKASPPQKLRSKTSSPNKVFSFTGKEMLTLEQNTGSDMKQKEIEAGYKKQQQNRSFEKSQQEIIGCEKQLQETTKSRKQQMPEDSVKPKQLDSGKLTADELKQRLSKCGGLAELKKRLTEFEKNKQIAQETTVSAIPAISRSPIKDQQAVSSANAQAASDVDRPSSLDNSSKTIPAFERYHALASPVSPTLLLPFSFQVLRDLFTSADTTVSMLDKRSEVCTFQKLTDAVQTMTKRSFELKHLGQIKTVYPTAYIFRQEKNLHLAGAKTSQYQLTIEANHDETDPATSGNRNASCMQGKFTIDKLISRRTIFHCNLLNIVKKCHREFLTKLNIVFDHHDDDLQRWHPKFDVDLVPDIAVADLPKPPVDEKVLRGANDVLEEAKRKNKEINPHLLRALEKVIASNLEPSSNSSASTTPTVSQPSTAQTTTLTSLTRGIPQSLLDKIRAKEAKKIECAMVRTPVQDQRISMLERLPELMRILRGQFVTQKKPALAMKDCCACLADSYKSNLGSAETEAHVKLIAELAPELLTIVNISRGVYVKLNVNTPLAAVTDKVTSLHKQALLV